MRNHYKLSNLLLSLGTTKQFGFTQKTFVLYLQLAILSFSLIRMFLIPWLLLNYIHYTAHKITLCSNIFICNINSHRKHQQGIITFTHLVTQAQWLSYHNFLQNNIWKTVRCTVKCIIMKKSPYWGVFRK